MKKKLLLFSIFIVSIFCISITNFGAVSELNGVTNIYVTSPIIITKVQDVTLGRNSSYNVAGAGTGNAYNFIGNIVYQVKGPLADGITESGVFRVTGGATPWNWNGTSTIPGSCTELQLTNSKTPIPDVTPIGTQALYACLQTFDTNPGTTNKSGATYDKSSASFAPENDYGVAYIGLKIFYNPALMPTYMTGTLKVIGTITITYDK